MSESSLDERTASRVAGGRDAAAPVQLSASASGPQVLLVPAPAGHTVWWVLTVVLAVIATALMMHRDDAALTRAALAQVAGASGAPMAGARGIYAFTGQLTSKSYGLFMMDVDSGTIWCYEMQRGASGEPQMKLVAARSWIFDRYLEEFNVADPIPSAVRGLVQQQQGRQAPTAVPVAGSAPALPSGQEVK